MSVSCMTSFSTCFIGVVLEEERHIFVEISRYWSVVLI
ncbi:hypothetical protein PUN28_002999 [Cardiocondyla obscurior]|uniref:NADH dehydrogenase subunit 1 n=1 Tax=Cardiocondyla obscurior TaxID=286306 RepID=A0AAW2GX27_9HYME